MPPAPSCSRISYAPKRVPGDKVDGTAPGVSGGPMNLIAQLLNSQADCSTLRGHVELILESMPRRVAAPPLDALIIPKPWGIHGYSNTTAPTEGAVSPKSVEFANHPEGTPARQTHRSRALWTWAERSTRHKPTKASGERVLVPAPEIYCWVQ